MFVTIMIDGSIKRNLKSGFELQSARVIEKRNKKIDLGFGVFGERHFYRVKSLSRGCSAYGKVVMFSDEQQMKG